MSTKTVVAIAIGLLILIAVVAIIWYSFSHRGQETSSCGNQQTLLGMSVGALGSIKHTTGSSLQDCDNECEKQDCQIYSYDARNKVCYIANLLPVDEKTNTAFKTHDTTCPYVYYDKTTYTDKPQPVINGITEGECEKRCTEDAQCDFYTFNTSGSCTLNGMSRDDYLATFLS